MPLQRSETETKRKGLPMTIQDVADRLGVSKKKAWTAVKCGQLEAVKVKRGNAWRYSITEDAVEAYRLFLESSDGWDRPEECAETENATRNVSQETETQRNETATEWAETFGNRSETLRELFDRLEMSHRKQIFLEMQLQQSQRLLCEVNEDQHEREARAKQAEAKAVLALEREAEAIAQAESAKQEAIQAQIELESLKVEVAAREAAWAEKRKPWYKRLFGSSVG